MRRPLHSAQRRTGQAPGEPHRSQSGGASRISPSRHPEQSPDPGTPQAAQRFGSRTSRSTASTVRSAVSRVCHVFVTIA